MNYFRSRSSTLFGVAVILIFCGITILTDPESVVSSGVRGDVTPTEGMVLILIGVVAIAISYIWYRVVKKLNEDINVPNVVRTKVHKPFFKRYIFHWLTLPILVFLILFLTLAPLPQYNNGFLIFLVFMGTFIATPFWLYSLLMKWIESRYERTALEIVDRARELSYIPEMEKEFPFPTKIFASGINGVAEFAVKKMISGIHVRIFQYAHVQRQGKNDTTIRYTVIGIETNDELPTFNFIKIPSKDISEPDLPISELDYRLKEEIPNSSKVQFSIPALGEFQLSVAKKFEIEALQIFSQTLAENFAQNWPTFLVSGEDRDLFAISGELVNKKEGLQKYDQLAQFLVNNIALRIKLIGRSVEAMEEAMAPKNITR
jgi:hypothetical protein